MYILVFNCGSSSIKFALVHPQTGQAPLTGLAERLGSPQAELGWKLSGQKQQRLISSPGDHKAAMRAIVELIEAQPQLASAVVGIGHRVVHGGETFSDSVRIGEAERSAIRELGALAPLHNPVNLLGIEVAQECWPALPHVAVFDTAFHATMPRRAYLYAVPYAWYEELHIRRYGFHGTSHRFVAEVAAEQLGLALAQSCLVTAHLGNGCSLAAIEGGKSVDTTMGLTPLEGLAMGTRSGDVDPSIFEFLGKAKGWDAKRVTAALNKESGLLGISGRSNDMRTLSEAAVQGDERAALAIEVFCYRLAKQIAAMATALPRLDALVFTGGIGENAALVRQQAISHLAVLGFQCSPERNVQHGRASNGHIGVHGKPAIMVIPTNEELQIARETIALVSVRAGV